MKRKLPIGRQDFAGIREDNNVYVDKTGRVHEFLTGSGKAFFLSRPRRFGKSLLCSTLAAIFEGRRDLFAGLAIDKLDWDWKKRPVVRIDLNPGDYGKGAESLDNQLNTSLDLCSRSYGVPLEGNDASSRFRYLLSNLREKTGERAAVIIDEYDKPLLSTLDNPELHKTIRSALRGFYSVLKSSDEYLCFAFLTGITKFSKVSIFSELNHLSDLTLNSRYADICGITQEELERDFAPEIEEVLRETGRDRGEYLQRLKDFYNGYRFTEKNLSVYNPYGLLNHFYEDGKFRPYWFETATPAFLVKLIETQHIDIANLEKLTVSESDFIRYDAENMNAVPLLYQTGYLTISGYDETWQEYSLDYPNEEVRSSFANSLLALYLHAPQDEKEALTVRLPRMLRTGDPEGAMETLRSFMASIPYDIVVEGEKYFQTVVHIVFRMLGFNARSEVRIAAGRIDTLVELPDYVYCFEFKLERAEGGESGKKLAELAALALGQIDSKDYLLPWRGSGKKLIKAGVAFDYGKRNIGAWRISGPPLTKLKILSMLTM
jgi:hypothetical protein